MKAGVATLVTGAPSGGPFADWGGGFTNGVASNIIFNGVHTNASNYLCVDGHVKSLPATRVSFGWDANSQTVASPGVGCIAASNNCADGTSASTTNGLTFSPV